MTSFHRHKDVVLMSPHQPNVFMPLKRRHVHMNGWNATVYGYGVPTTSLYINKTLLPRYSNDEMGTLQLTECLDDHGEVDYFRK